MEKLILRKADLVLQVSRVAELPQKHAAYVVELIMGSITGALRRGERVEIRGFGTFALRQRRARIGRNPKTGAEARVPAKKIVYFKASEKLLDLVDH